MPLPATEVVRSLVEALIEVTLEARHPAIRMGLDWLRGNEEPNITKLPPWVKTKSCYNCGQPIFFAARPRKRTDGSYAWVPMSPHPLMSDAVILDAVHVNFVLGREGSPSLEDPTPGVQWMPHSVMCGRRDRPADVELGLIWDKTNKRDIDEEDQVVENLLKMLEDTE